MTAPVQLGLAGMPARLYSCTPSRLASWLDCPRRYRMAYLDRPMPQKGPPWAHNSFGLSLHNALAGWWRLPVDRRTVDAARDLLLESWIDRGYQDDAQSRQTQTRALDMVERYVRRLDPADEPVGIERTVATKTPKIAVSGRIDRLDRRMGEDGEELVVVDYKTGRHVLTTDDARGSMAMALYAIAAARVLRDSCRRVELHHLPTGEVVSWEHSEESLERHLRRAEDIAGECASADEAYRRGERGDDVFPPQVSVLCGWCDFAEHCPEGRRAVPTKVSWAGIEFGAPTTDE